MVFYCMTKLMKVNDFYGFIKLDQTKYVKYKVIIIHCLFWFKIHIYDGAGNYPVYIINIVKIDDTKKRTPILKQELQLLHNKQQ
jgi:hypothetical protein